MKHSPQQGPTQQYPPQQPPGYPVQQYPPTQYPPQAQGPMVYGLPRETPPPKKNRALIITVVVLVVVIIIMATLFLLFLLKRPSPLEGKWNIDSVEIYGEQIPANGTVEFKSDGTFRVNLRYTDPLTNMSVVMSTPYQVDWEDLGNGRVRLSSAGIGIIYGYTISGDNLTLDTSAGGSSVTKYYCIKD